MKCNAVVQTSRSMKYTYRYQRFICLPVMQEIGEMHYWNFIFYLSLCMSNLLLYLTAKKPQTKTTTIPPPTQKK